MSSEKAARVGERRRLRNRNVRTSTRTFVRKAEAAVAGQDSTNAQQDVRRAIKALDQAHQKGVLHKNNAARKKSRLMTKLNRSVKGQS